MDLDGSGIGKVLQSVGISSMGLEKIRFGTGVVGKMTTSLIAILSVLGLLSLAGVVRNNLQLTYIGAGGCVFAFLFSQIAIMLFASKHPATAILEGAELVRYHQVEMAAKGLSLPSPQPNVEPSMIEAVEVNDENVQLEHKVGEISD